MTTKPPLSPASRMYRLLLIAGSLGALSATLGYACGLLDPGRLTPAKLVDTLERNAGVHEGYRRNHAKGFCVTGYFAGNGAASELSSAHVFGKIRTPVTGRFAIPGGNPDAQDGRAPLRSLALQFLTDDGQEWRTAMNSSPVFIVSTPEAFYQLLLANTPQADTGKVDKNRLATFFQTHPESRAFRQWMSESTPSSGFSNTVYNGLNAFYLVAGNGRKTPVRWSVIPHDAFQPVGDAAVTDDHFLKNSFSERLTHGPVRWNLMLTIGSEEDPVNNATIRWPGDRQTVNAGELVIEQMAAEEAGSCRDINYDPLILPPGISSSDDPLLSARSATYSESFNRRIRERAENGKGVN